MRSSCAMRSTTCCARSTMSLELRWIYATRLSASPVRAGLAVLDQLAPGQLAQADIEYRRQEQAEQGDPDHAGAHGDAGRRAHLGAGAVREHQRDRAEI